MFEVIWKGVKGFLSVMGGIFTFMQNGASLLNKKDDEEE